MQLSATTKVSLLLLLFAPCCCARSIIVDGTASLDDGRPVKGGTIIFYEYRGEVGRMPDARPLVVLVTDKNGKFHAELTDIRGDVEVSLVRDWCDWTWTDTHIFRKNMTNKDHFNVKLDSRREQCEGRGH